MKQIPINVMIMLCTQRFTAISQWTTLHPYPSRNMECNKTSLSRPCPPCTMPNQEMECLNLSTCMPLVFNQTKPFTTLQLLYLSTQSHPPPAHNLLLKLQQTLRPPYPIESARALTYVSFSGYTIGRKSYYRP